MNDVTIQLLKGNPKKFLDRTIMDRSGSDKVHTRIYFKLPDETFEVTVWGGPLKSGMLISYGELPCDLSLGFRMPLTQDQIIRGIDEAIAMANNRHWYAFLLLAFDYFLIPTRRFWNWVYRKTGWAPFNGGSDCDCSMAVDRIVKAMGIDLFPDRAESLTVPGDFEGCPLLEVV